jgi:regulator of replication initiation timing
MAYAEIDLDEYEDEVLRDASTAALEEELDRRVDSTLLKDYRDSERVTTSRMEELVRENTALKIENSILKQRLGRFDCNINLKVVNQ